MDPVDQAEEDICAQAHGKHVDRCVDVPAKPLGELFEHDDRRIARSHEEHIHVLSQTELDKAVQSKGNTAQRHKGPGRAPVVGLLIATAFGEADEKSHKHQKHMPYAGMERQKPVSVQQPGGLCKGDGAAQKVIQYHKAVHSPLQLTGLQPGSDQTHIHGDAAELEGEVAPGVAVFHHYEIIKELLKNLRDR